MLMNTLVLNLLSKLNYAVLAKMGVTVASKSNLSPVITKNMVLLLLDPIKDGLFYFYPGESFGVEDKSNVVVVVGNLINVLSVSGT